MNSKKWIKLSFFISCFVIITVVFFNYSIDSLGLLREGMYDKIAKNLSEGKIIAGLSDCDDRILRKKQIEYLENDIEYIALGSSRIMQLRKEMFSNGKNVSFRNYSVNGASLEDYMALLQIYKNKFKKFPKNIIFGLDPWIFNRNNGQKRYISLINDYLKFLNSIGLSDDTPKHANNFLYSLSFDYMIKNIKNFINLQYYISDNINIDDFLRMPDGSVYYPYKKRFPNLKEVEIDAKGDFYSLYNYYDFYNINVFERFILFLKSFNTSIYFYLPPYNPITYRDIMSNDKYIIVNDVENYLRNFANKNSIKVIGSYNPDNYNLNTTYFFDGIHALDSAYNIIFRDMLE